MNSKRLNRISILLGVLLCSSNAWSLFNICCPAPYFGADAQLRHMSWVAAKGNNIFNHNLPQSNIYAGLKINCFFGVEVGQETAANRHRNVTLMPGSMFLNNLVDEQATLNTTISARGFHSNVIAYYPICGEKLELFGNVGFVKLALKHRTVEILQQADSVTRTFKKSRWIPRFGLGIRQMLTECTGIRGMMILEKLSRFRNIAPLASESPTSVLRVDAKSSLIYSFGFFVYF